MEEITTEELYNKLKSIAYSDGEDAMKWFNRGFAYAYSKKPHKTQIVKDGMIHTEMGSIPCNVTMPAKCPHDVFSKDDTVSYMCAKCGEWIQYKRS